MRSQLGTDNHALAFTSAPFAFGGADRGASPSTAISDEPPRFDFAIESAYLFGAFNPPRNYEISADFLTARMRWGNYLDREGFFRGYNQVYFSFLAEPIIRGIENHYFGMNLGLRYNFVRHGSRFVPYFSGGVGLGCDRQPSRAIRGARAGFHLQYSQRRGRFLSIQRPL